jgi:hypothetical protein
MTKKNPVSWGDDDFPTINSNAATALTDMVKEVTALENKMSEHHEELGKLNERRAALQTDLIPNLMMELGLRSFKTATGESVDIRDVISGNLPAPTTIARATPEEQKALSQRRKDGLKWLTKHFPEVVKCSVAVAFDKGDAKKAEVLVKQLQVSYGKGAVSLDVGVHPATLNKVLYESITAGKPAPVDIFNVWVGYNAVIKRRT